MFKFELYAFFLHSYKQIDRLNGNQVILSLSYFMNRVVIVYAEFLGKS